MKVLVTGGAGFIGANVSRTLVESGHDVVVLDDLSTGSRRNLEGVRVRLVEGSILETQALKDASWDCESVIHLAAIPSVPRSVKDPVRSHETNATGTLRVLEAARQHGQHVVVASSSSVYGGNTELPKREDMWTRPLSPYAVSKLATEAYTLAYQSTYGLSTIPFRFFNVYGPLQAAGHAYAAVVPAFLNAALNGDALVIEGDGQQTRDFTYIDTVTSVLCQAAVNKVSSPEPVNLALGTRRSIMDLAHLVIDVVGAGKVQHVAPRTGDVRDSQAASERLRRLFPKVAATPLPQGIATTAAWMAEDVESRPVISRGGVSEHA